ncbi:hypothetical protein N665_1895s0008 [Sinapis alba]|nr:hypothetical protein N665_1895s0008 [Sinapis alba]
MSTHRQGDNSSKGCDKKIILRRAFLKYRVEISVYDNGEKAIFVLLGDTGPELTGRQASKLIDNYFEMPTPKCLVEVSSYNFTIKRQTIIVTKVVCPAVLPPFVVAENQLKAIVETAHAPGVIQFCYRWNLQLRVFS